jgi:hypothetical protein
VTLTARWGEQLDVRHITEAGDEQQLSAEQVAGYIAKYATRANAVALGVWWGEGWSDGDGLGGWLGRLGPVAVSALLDPKVGHLAFDDAGLAAQAPGGQQVGEQVIPQPLQRPHQALRGKTRPARR